MKKYGKIILTILYIFIITVLQTTVLKSIEIFGVMPNLMLVSVICYALVNSDLRGILFGVACGLLLDVTGGRIVGINTLLCTYTAFVCVWICDRLYNNNELVASVFAIVITIIYELIMFLVNFIIWGKTGIGYALLCKILPMALYNAFAAIFLYPIVKRLAKEKRRRKRKKQEFYN